MHSPELSQAFLSVVVYSLSEHRHADANSVITLIDGGFRKDPPNITCIIFSILRLLRNCYYHERHLCHEYMKDAFPVIRIRQLSISVTPVREKRFAGHNVMCLKTCRMPTIGCSYLKLSKSDERIVKTSTERIWKLIYIFSDTCKIIM